MERITSFLIRGQWYLLEWAIQTGCTKSAHVTDHLGNAHIDHIRVT